MQLEYPWPNRSTKLQREIAGLPWNSNRVRNASRAQSAIIWKLKPILYSSDKELCDVLAGDYHSLAYISDSIHASGLNVGQFGRSAAEDRLIYPKKVWHPSLWICWGNINLDWFVFSCQHFLMRLQWSIQVMRRSWVWQCLYWFCCVQNLKWRQYESSLHMRILNTLRWLVANR